ncbi:unnamed protein product [Pseudo-nitzschia multistriata]|uniref:Uncharacterized protein n=1 Tax=Pseudo-nitzschia multistriata TaxID=183589 RepID=A0A448ZHU7_9STRA|nr:unnamed protein product [Pseudo-nitzschia multistriata]
MAVGVPPRAAISGPGKVGVEVPQAAIGLDCWIDFALGKPPVALAFVPFGAVVVLGVVAATPKRPVRLLVPVVADPGGVLEDHRNLGVAEAPLVALRSGAAISDVFALVVPRDATLVVRRGVRKTGCVVLVLELTDVSGVAFLVLDANFAIVVGRHKRVVVVAAAPLVSLGLVIWRQTVDGTNT